MKRIFLSTLAILSISSMARAAPLVLPEDSPLYISFINIELVDFENRLVIPSSDPYYAGFTQGNWGLVVVESITTGFVQVGNENEEIDSGLPVLFSNTLLPAGAQITGVFYDIQIQSPTSATGGFLDLYWQEDASLQQPQGGDTPSDFDDYIQGTFLARIAFAPGVAAPDCNTTIFTTTASLNDPNGVAESYGNVVAADGGAWADALDSNYFNNPCTGPLSSDIRFKNSFNLEQSGPWSADPNVPGSFGFTSEDPAQAHTTAAVPEPTTLALLGFGLIGLARGYRRRHG